LIVPLNFNGGYEPFLARRGTEEMLNKEETLLVVVDVQGKLAQLMHHRDDLFRNLQTLVRGMQLLGIPIILMEQTPEKLGSTVDEIRNLLSGIEPISKKSFSCAGEPRFVARLEKAAPRDILLAGIETHVCVYQTAADLIARGFGVHVVADAVSSRSELNKEIGLKRILADGGNATSTEMLLFELQRNAEGDTFRELIRLVK
jgi:nicotinamidase-related amidase